MDKVSPLKVICPKQEKGGSRDWGNHDAKEGFVVGFSLGLFSLPSIPFC